MGYLLFNFAIPLFYQRDREQEIKYKNGGKKMHFPFNHRNISLGKDMLKVNRIIRVYNLSLC